MIHKTIKENENYFSLYFGHQRLNFPKYNWIGEKLREKY